MDRARCFWLVFAAAMIAAPRVLAQEAKPSPAADRKAALAAQLLAANAEIDARPHDANAYRRRAAIHAAAEDHALAIADYDRAITLAPDTAQVYDERGSQHFMLGHIHESIQDFDRAIQLRPEQEPGHWKRGISYFYAGRYDDGRKQFEGYQTVDDNDVENAVWRYLCMARSTSVARARGDMLPIKRDARVPMMEVYALYGGKARPEDVLAAALAGSPAPEARNARLFYAHLYLGLYYEVAGDAQRAREHLTAARQHKIDHFMWNVADIHARLLKPAGPGR